MMRQSNQGDVTVGMTASLTGRYSYPGRQVLAGAQAWCDDVNLSGGIRLRRGRQAPVRLVHHDDGSKVRTCAELTERLIVDDNVDILLGPYSSGLALEAACVAQKHATVLWNHGGASEAMYGQGHRSVVGILSPASTYFHGIVDMARESRPQTSTVAILHSTAGAFPREVAAGAEKRCRERGFRTVRTYSFNGRTTDFDDLLGRLEPDRPDLVLGVGRIEDDMRLAQQYAERGRIGGAVGLIATPLTLFRETLGDEANGFLGPSQWEPGAIGAPDYGPTSEEVLKSLKARRPEGVDYPMAQAYAGCLVVQRCIEAAGSLDNRLLREVAGELDFTTFYGRYLIDPTTGRQLGHVMPVVQWRRGEKVVVWPPEMAQQDD